MPAVLRYPYLLRFFFFFGNNCISALVTDTVRPMGNQIFRAAAEDAAAVKLAQYQFVTAFCDFQVIVQVNVQFIS